MDQRISFITLAVADLDANGGVEQVTLTAGHGQLTLSGTTGLSFLVGSGAGDATMTFQGTIADINAALAGLAYAPSSFYIGSDTLQVTVDDLGNTGGAAQTGTGTVAITVMPTNPVVMAITSTSANGSYKVGDTITETVTFDHAVTVDTGGGTPTLLLDTGTVDHAASYVSGSGTNTFSTQINANTLTMSGTGTTTLAGTGNNNINTTSINGGTLVLDKTSGTALTGSVTVGSGGTLEMAGDNQTTAWTNLTLGAGSTLELNNTTQTIANLTITGDTVIDFGGGGSTLNVSSLSVIVMPSCWRKAPSVARLPAVVVENGWMWIRPSPWLWIPSTSGVASDGFCSVSGYWSHW